MKNEFARFFDFIVIDDSKLDLIIAQKMLKRVNEDLQVQTFEEAPAALNYINNRAPLPASRRTVLLIDLRMPLMDGFQFAESFSQLPENIRRQYVPCILTSSIAEADRNRAAAIPVLYAFLNKPPDAAVLESLLLRYLEEHKLMTPDA